MLVPTKSVCARLNSWAKKIRIIRNPRIKRSTMEGTSISDVSLSNEVSVRLTMQGLSRSECKHQFCSA